MFKLKVIYALKNIFILQNAKQGIGVKTVPFPAYIILMEKIVSTYVHVKKLCATSYRGVHKGTLLHVRNLFHRLLQNIVKVV